MAAQSKSDRHVLSVSTDGGSKGSSLVDKIKGGSYTDEQFRSLSEHDKKRVQKFREEAKRKKKEKQKVRKEKRKLAKDKSDRDEASGDEDVATEPTASSAITSSAGSQFGSNGTKAKKAKH
jgi:hypothetical protein